MNDTLQLIIVILAAIAAAVGLWLQWKRNRRTSSKGEDCSACPLLDSCTKPSKKSPQNPRPKPHP